MKKRTEQVKADVDAPAPNEERADSARQGEAQVDAPREAYPYPVEIDGVGVITPTPAEES